MKPPSARRMKAYHAAEEACRALRGLIAKEACLTTAADWNEVLEYMLRWMQLSGKTRYDKPAPLRGKRHA